MSREVVTGKPDTIILLEEREKFKEQLVNELVKQFFWYYQIGDRVEPFGFTLPTADQVVTRFGSEHFPKNFDRDYYSVFVFTARHVVLYGGVDIDNLPPPGEWDWPYISSPIDGVKHSLNGWRKSKQ